MTLKRIALAVHHPTTSPTTPQASRQQPRPQRQATRSSMPPSVAVDVVVPVDHHDHHQQIHRRHHPEQQRQHQHQPHHHQIKYWQVSSQEALEGLLRRYGVDALVDPESACHVTTYVALQETVPYYVLGEPAATVELSTFHHRRGRPHKHLTPT